MRLNHLDLHVPDVAATCEFFVRVFGLTLVEMRGAAGLAILNDDSGLELVISRPHPKFGGADGQASGITSYHVGFILNTRSEVLAVFQAAKAGGADIWQEPREMRGGLVFYAYAPGRVLVEVMSRD
jgi:catechol 2,3-dioxygenase-like lactoylglutathione lyase family enzyme